MGGARGLPNWQFSKYSKMAHDLVPKSIFKDGHVSTIKKYFYRNAVKGPPQTPSGLILWRDPR